MQPRFRPVCCPFWVRVGVKIRVKVRVRVRDKVTCALGLRPVLVLTRRCFPARNNEEPPSCPLKILPDTS